MQMITFPLASGNALLFGTEHHCMFITCGYKRLQSVGTRHTLQYIVIATEPWERLGINITGPHPTSTKGNVFILTVINHFSKWVELFPMRSQEAATLSQRQLPKSWWTQWFANMAAHYKYWQSRTEFRKRAVQGNMQKAVSRQGPDLDLQAVDKWQHRAFPRDPALDGSKTCQY